jgi:hypothetical protein
MAEIKNSLRCPFCSKQFVASICVYGQPGGGSLSVVISPECKEYEEAYSNDDDSGDKKCSGVTQSRKSGLVSPQGASSRYGVGRRVER